MNDASSTPPPAEQPAGPPGDRTSVLILGGAGSVGRSVARRLGGLGHRVILAGRTASTLKRAAASITDASTRVLDARDPAAITQAAAAVGVVINGSGLEGPEVVTPWLDAGCDVIDITASGTRVAELDQLSPRAATLVLGVGLVPGLSSLLAGRVHDHDPGGAITVSTLLGLGEAYGPASAQWTLGQLGHRIEDPGGAFRNFSDPRPVGFPGGFGRRRARRFDFADRTLLARRLGVTVTTRLCFDSRIATESLALAARVPTAATALLRASPLAPRLPLGEDWWAVTAETATGHGAWAVGRSSVEATALMTALTADRLVTDRAPGPGVVLSTEVLGGHHIDEELAGEGIGLGWSQAGDGG